MNYAKINKLDTANGIGCRVSLFVSGCRIKCPGCHNPEAQEFSYGKAFGRFAIKKVMDALEPYWIDGLSILGGEPLEPENRLRVENLCMSVKDKYPNKTIWLYTGHVMDITVLGSSIFNWVDVVVDGPYVEKLRDPSLEFRGSSNQRIIDVQESRKKGEIVLYEFTTAADFGESGKAAWV